MRIFSNILLAILSVSAVFSCTQKDLPCPFKATIFWILQPGTKPSTYFGEDTMPRQDMAVANKNQFGIVEEPLPKKLWEKLPPPINDPFDKIASIDKEVVYPQIPDTVELTGDELIFAEVDIPVDTTAVQADSLDGKIWHFNVEQDNYFRYLRKRLGYEISFVDGDLENLEESQVETSATDISDIEGEGEGGKKKKKGGFFKKLLKKKKKDDPATDPEATPEEKEEDAEDDGNGN